MANPGTTVGVHWRKSSWSGDQNCVEIADRADGVHVRDSKDVQGSVLAFSAAEWTAFLRGAKAGEFDR